MVIVDVTVPDGALVATNAVIFVTTFPAATGQGIGFCSNNNYALK